MTFTERAFCSHERITYDGRGRTECGACGAPFVFLGLIDPEVASALLSGEPQTGGEK